MLAAPHRLRRPADINRVHARGRYGRADSLHAKVLTNGLNLSRGVVVVGRKVSKKAVVRNRLRRQLAAQLAELWATVPAGYDLVITVHAEPAANPAGLKKQLEQALTAAGLKFGPVINKGTDSV